MFGQGHLDDLERRDGGVRVPGGVEDLEAPELIPFPLEFAEGQGEEAPLVGVVLGNGQVAVVKGDSAGPVGQAPLDLRELLQGPDLQFEDRHRLAAPELGPLRPARPPQIPAERPFQRVQGGPGPLGVKAIPEIIGQAEHLPARQSEPEDHHVLPHVQVEKPAFGDHGRDSA